jgi:hypothetical protein
MCRIDETGLAGGSSLNDSLGVFLDLLGAQIAFPLGIVKDERKGWNDADKDKQDEAPAQSVLG